jgi:putative ABC transport system ATP-binding protein
LIEESKNPNGPSKGADPPVIQLTQLRKSFSVGDRRLEVLKGIDLLIAAGEFVSVMGPSGSGKSTLLNVIGLLDDYDSGEYLLNGLSTEDLSPTQAAGYRSRMVSFVFQAFNLLQFKTALENVALPLYYQGLKRDRRLDLARDYLARVGLADRADHSPGQMSGGEQQRVAIARALISRPMVLLADEPTGALDTTTSRQVVDLLREVNREGITVIVVTHEHEIAAMTDRTVRIRDGLIVSDGGIDV